MTTVFLHPGAVMVTVAGPVPLSSDIRSSCAQPLNESRVKRRGDDDADGLSAERNAGSPFPMPRIEAGPSTSTVSGRHAVGTVRPFLSARYISTTATSPVPCFLRFFIFRNAESHVLSSPDGPSSPITLSLVHARVIIGIYIKEAAHVNRHRIFSHILFVWPCAIS